MVNFALLLFLPLLPLACSGRSHPKSAPTSTTEHTCYGRCGESEYCDDGSERCLSCAYLCSKLPDACRQHCSHYLKMQLENEIEALRAQNIALANHSEHLLEQKEQQIAVLIALKNVTANHTQHLLKQKDQVIAVLLADKNATDNHTEFDPKTWTKYDKITGSLLVIETIIIAFGACYFVKVFIQRKRKRKGNRKIHGQHDQSSLHKMESGTPLLDQAQLSSLTQAGSASDHNSMESARTSSHNSSGIPTVIVLDSNPPLHYAEAVGSMESGASTSTTQDSSANSTESRANHVQEIPPQAQGGCGWNTQVSGSTVEVHRSASSLGGRSSSDPESDAPPVEHATPQQVQDIVEDQL